MNRWICIVISLSGLLISFEDSGPQTFSQIPCLRVKDGDTVEVWLQGRKQAIRLAYIDAPEKKQLGINFRPWGKFASHRLAQLIEGKKIKLVIMDIGYYGRPIAEIYIDGTLVNLAMISEGMAIIYPYSRFRSVKQKFIFWSALVRARNQRKGQWSATKFLNPKIFRQNKQLRSLYQSR